MLRAIVLALTMMLTTASFATETYTIGIKEAKPFSYKENGEWKGLSVDLIKLLAADMGFDYNFIESSSVAELIQQTSTHKVDFSIAAISTTADREKVIDFSQPYFSTSLGILSSNKTTWIDNAIWIGKRIGLVLLALVVGLYTVGWLADKIDGDDNIRNPHEGAWWALVTFTTTGYGDFVPKTARGKIFASIWMVASLFLLSTFTGYMASAMTLKQLTSTPTTIGDLYNSSVVTITGSTSQEALNSLVGIKYTTVSNINEAINLIERNRVKAFVYDDTMLNYYASTHNTQFSVTSVDLKKENYAIVFSQGSPLTDKFNVGILRVMTSFEWKNVCHKYFNQ